MQMQLDGGTWVIGSRLADGEGGFGQVFDVVNAEGVAAVAKLVPKDPGAERELLFGDSLAAAEYRNVVPVLDKGEHLDHWVLVMPKADRSLARHLAQLSGPLQVAEAVEVLTDIVTALADLDGHVVHRDLKPANVLLLSGTWCLADFGIARYAEDATVTNTRKFNLSPPYAAPEQWRLERASNATDMYAFGVMAYEILSGERPFLGPDFRSQHLNDPAPTLTSGTLALRALIEECLWKPPAMRPTAANALQRLANATRVPATGGESRLAQVNQAESERLAHDHAAASHGQETERQRTEMFGIATATFASIVTPLRAAIEAHAPLAEFEPMRSGSNMMFVAHLQAGKLGVSVPFRVGEWQGPFDVLAHAQITVLRSGRDTTGYEGRSHSMWFCDAREAGRYGWYELAFMESPFSRAQPAVEPDARTPDEAAIAFGGVTGSMQLAWPPTEIDRTDPADFVDRWTGWFADAAEGRLQRPSAMPERPTAGSWRRS